MALFQRGNTAVITGGASGIGLALAAKCLAHGMRVVVADRDEATLAAAPANAAAAVKAAQEAKAARPETLDISNISELLQTVHMDVSRAADWARMRAAVDSHLGGAVHLLALNAGTGGASPWSEPAAFQRIWDVNVLGVVHGLSTLLTAVEKTASSSSSSSSSSFSSIVITGSKQGITNPPGTSPAYNASKAAVKSLAEQLAFDLAKRAPAVSVHLLVPGWTFTGLSGNRPPTDKSDTTTNTAKPKPAGAWWPSQVVDYLVPAIAARQFYVLCPDNDVTEAQDSRRVLWSAGDVAHKRAALSRWRPEYKDEFDAWMQE